MTKEFGRSRADKYKLAMREAPHARTAELEHMSLPRQASRVLDIGAGDGFLTKYLIEKYPGATVVAYEPSRAMHTSNIEYACILPHSKSRYDLACSLATMHHVSEKEMLFTSVYDLLVPESMFILSDVADCTPVQSFFDGVVNRYNPDGHDYPFLDVKQVEKLSHGAGFLLLKAEICSTPWKFRDRQQKIDFVKNLLGLELDDATLSQQLDTYLPSDDSSTLPWQLGYYYMKKC